MILSRISKKAFVIYAVALIVICIVILIWCLICQRPKNYRRRQRQGKKIIADPEANDELNTSNTNETSLSKSKSKSINANNVFNTEPKEEASVYDQNNNSNSKSSNSNEVTNDEATKFDIVHKIPRITNKTQSTRHNPSSKCQKLAEKQIANSKKIQKSNSISAGKILVSPKDSNKNNDDNEDFYVKGNIASQMTYFRKKGSDNDHEKDSRFGSMESCEVDAYEEVMKRLSDKVAPRRVASLYSSYGELANTVIAGMQE